MNFRKTLIAGAVLTSFLAVGSAQAEGELQGGFGLGIPFGGIGGGLEYAISDVVGITGGLGITPAGLGFSVGARAYMPTTGNFQPRLTFLHGVVAILEKSSWSGSSEYENLTGQAYGVGFGWTRASGNILSFDLLVVDFTTPEGTINSGGDVKISIGYTWKL